MSTPKYKGHGQPTPDASCGWLGVLFGGFFGGATVPPYKTTPTPTPAPPPCPPAPPCPPCKLATESAKAPVQQGGDACDAVPVPIGLDEYGDAVIPVGPGPITIVINPRA